MSDATPYADLSERQLLAHQYAAESTEEELVAVFDRADHIIRSAGLTLSA